MAEIYRDRSEGSAAKRQELLRRRRDELVTMPHAVRRVVVARQSRVAASMTAALLGVALLAATWSPPLARAIAHRLPGIQPAAIATVLFAGWVLPLLAWAVSRARVEHRFAVAMSRYVLPSTDVDHDVERLDHEHPDAIARAMGHDLEVRSAAWPLVAAGVLVPSTVVWFWWQVRVGGWPTSPFEDSLVLHPRLLAALGGLGVIAAIALTRKAMRRPAVASVALPLGALVTGGGIAAFVADLPGAWAIAGVGVASLAIGLVVRTLRRERALLEVEDPAAGSELFTLRGAWRELRAGLAVVRSLLLRVRRRHWLMLAGAGVVSMGVGLYLRPRPQALMVAVPPDPAALGMTADELGHDPIISPAPLPAVAEHAQTVAVLPRSSIPGYYSVDQVGARFDLQVTPGDVARVVPLMGYSVVPLGWQAELEVYLDGEGSITLLDSGGAHVTLDHRSRRTAIDVRACNNPSTLALEVLPGPAQPVTLHVRPTLRLADCGPPPGSLVP
ncbi:MAG TPA: hypothetical protein VHE35_29000 [Kofleriaceae bacterium]|nr:hypothetical protein [Kofleriaceae bacterium]